MMMMMMIIMIRNDKNNSVVGDDIDVDANDDEQWAIMIYMIITTLRSATAFFFKDFSFFLANALLGLNIIVVVWVGIDCMLRQMKWYKMMIWWS